VFDGVAFLPQDYVRELGMQYLYYLTPCTPGGKDALVGYSDTSYVRTVRMIGYWQHTVVCPSACAAVHCGAQGWCRG